MDFSEQETGDLLSRLGYSASGHLATRNTEFKGEIRLDPIPMHSAPFSKSRILQVIIWFGIRAAFTRCQWRPAR